MYEKIVLVTRKTRLEELVERFNTRPQARFYIQHSGGDFSLYEREHETYHQSLTQLKAVLQGLLKTQIIERTFLPNFLFAETDLVITIGIDGLVVNTAKYLDGQPLVAINPDPQHIDGVLLPFKVAQAQAVVRKLLQNQAAIRPITMAEAVLNDGQRLLAFNDLFIGRQDHVSARYRLAFAGQQESHSSSGIIVSTGAGATGWLSSLFNMANGMLRGFGGEMGEGLTRPQANWETNELYFVVREPFVSKTSAAGVVCGRVTSDTPLQLESQMAEGGVIFSDGVAADYLAFNAGTQATITLARQKTRLVVG